MKPPNTSKSTSDYSLVLGGGGGVVGLVVKIKYIERSGVFYEL